MEEQILLIKNIRKTYKKIVAVEGLDLEIKRGQVLGFLGPNGSGKTTTLAMLLGVLIPDSGTYSWFGNGEKDENRKKIGALLETPNFYPYMNPVDNLIVVAKIKGMTDYMPAIEKALTRVNLWERRKSSFRTFSLGMKQRLAIASALLSDPEVLVLDEPTNGLDPMGIAEIRLLIQKIAEEGKTIIIASHILDEIEKICTHVAILRKGKLLSYGTLAEILSQEKLYIIKAKELSVLKTAIDKLLEVKMVNELENEFVVSMAESMDAEQLNRSLAEQGIYLSELREHRKSLETTFIEMIEA